MSQENNSLYEIRFRGGLTPRWVAWFDGFELNVLDNGDTLLRGAIHDQAELLGVLEKIANLNLQLISVNPASGSHAPS